MAPAIFLDRDGVIIHNVPDYVRTWDDVSFFDFSLSALRTLAQSSYKIVMVTNQSAVGRGIITLTQAHAINQKILSIISDAGGRVDGLYMCPHAPQDQCICRKPKPGLILQAAEELGLDLLGSALIGDALSDIQAGQAAGIPTNILITTGRGLEQKKLPQASTLPPYQVSLNLESAINTILSTQS